MSSFGQQVWQPSSRPKAGVTMGSDQDRPNGCVSIKAVAGLASGAVGGERIAFPHPGDLTLGFGRKRGFL